MNYTPTTWATGDVITAEKLNNMESGIVNAQRILVNITADENGNTHEFSNITIDKDIEELTELLNDGVSVAFRLHGSVVYGSTTVAEYTHYTSSCETVGSGDLSVNFFVAANGTFSYYVLYIATDNSVTLTRETYSLSPA